MTHKPLKRHIKYPSMVLIIGVGNQYRRDDGVGLAVAQRLKERQPFQTVVLEADGEGTGLVELWADFGRVILVDAVASGAAPGMVHRLDTHTQAVPTDFFRCSTHTFGVAEAIELARVLDKLPPSLIFYGIEGKDFSDGVGLSAEIESAVPLVVEGVLQEINLVRSG